MKISKICLYVLSSCIVWMSISASKEDIDINKMMPKPDKAGFKDDGVTKDEQLTQASQMDRYGIPDLNNPSTRQLTDLDFDICTGGESYCAVLFYSEEQKDYKYYALHWEKAAMEMQDSLTVYTSANVTMGRFDIAEPEHLDIVAKYEILQEKPMMKLFQNGKLVANIETTVSHNDIKQFIINRTLPPSTFIDSEFLAKKWKRRKQFNQANLKVLAYIEDNQEKVKKFNQVANQLQDHVQFAHVNKKDLFLMITKLEDAQNGDIVLIRDFDEPRVIPYTQTLTIANLVSFLQEYRNPILTNMHDTEEYKVRDFLGSSLKYRLISFFLDEEAFKKAESNLIAIAKENRHHALISYIIQDPKDPSNFDYTFWGVPGNTPSLLWIYMRRDRKYIYSGEDAFELETMRKLIVNATTGVLKPTLRSQVPPVNNNGMVKVLTTDSFPLEVYAKTEEDSMILFYHPHQSASQWIHHQLNRVAKIWRRERRLQIFSLDTSQNDIVEMESDDVPTLYYMSKQEKEQHQPLAQFLSIPYPDTLQIVQFVKNQTQMELVIDSKVLERLVEEEENLKKVQGILSNSGGVKNNAEAQSNSAGANNKIHGDAKASGKGNLQFNEKFHRLKEKLGVTDEDLPPMEEPETQMDGKKEMFVPASFEGLTTAHDLIQGELQAMLKKTGFKLPDDFEKNLDTKKLLSSVSWYNGMLFMLNLFITSIFGDGMTGAIVIALIVVVGFYGIPMTYRKWKQQRMKSWLTTFYKENNPNHMDRVDTIVQAYLNMNDGFNKLKEDATRKYVLRKEQETKKVK